MMGLLLNNEQVRRAKFRAGASGAISATDTWMGIYTVGKDGTETKIGYMRTQAIPEIDAGDEGVEYRLTLKLATQLLSFPPKYYSAVPPWSPEKTDSSAYPSRSTPSMNTS